MGHLYNKKRYNWNAGYLSVIFAVVVIIGSVCCYTTMLTFTTADILPYFCCAVLGTVMTLNVSQYIAPHENMFKRLLVFIGNNTMTILTWHFLCFKLVSLCIIYCNDLPIKQLACFPIIPEYKHNWWMAYFVIGAGVPVLLLFARKVIKI